MGFGTDPEPLGGWICERGDIPPIFVPVVSVSNFAAMSGSKAGRLSRADKTTSKIIDAFSNVNYAFLDVSVGFRIRYPLAVLQLRGMEKVRH
jgi:hypothetical protein